MLDGATSIALWSSGKNNGRVVVGGMTSSSNFPTSSGAFQSTFGGGDFDGFVAVLDENLQTVEYASYVGGQGFDVFFADAAAGNRIHVGGLTSSSNLPSSPDALQPGFAGSIDSYLLTLNLGAKGPSAVEFSTYFGGVGQDILSRPKTTPDQDFLFGRPGAYTIADYRLRCNGFRTAARFGTPFAAAPAFECWPIMAFQRSQRAL